MNMMQLQYTLLHYTYLCRRNKREKLPPVIISSVKPKPPQNVTLLTLRPPPISWYRFLLQNKVGSPREASSVSTGVSKSAAKTVGGGREENRHKKKLSSSSSKLKDASSINCKNHLSSEGTLSKTTPATASSECGDGSGSDETRGGAAAPRSKKKRKHYAGESKKAGIERAEESTDDVERAFGDRHERAVALAASCALNDGSIGRSSKGKKRRTFRGGGVFKEKKGKRSSRGTGEDVERSSLEAREKKKGRRSKAVHAPGGDASSKEATDGDGGDGRKRDRGRDKSNTGLQGAMSVGVFLDKVDDEEKGGMVPGRSKNGVARIIGEVEVEEISLHKTEQEKEPSSSRKDSAKRFNHQGEGGGQYQEPFPQGHQHDDQQNHRHHHQQQQQKPDLDVIVPPAPLSPGLVETSERLSREVEQEEENEEVKIAAGDSVRRMHGKIEANTRAVRPQPSAFADLRTTVVADSSTNSDAAGGEPQPEKAMIDREEDGKEEGGEEVMAAPGWVSPTPTPDCFLAPRGSVSSNNHRPKQIMESLPSPLPLRLPSQPLAVLPQRLSVSEDEDGGNETTSVTIDAVRVVDKRSGRGEEDTPMSVSSASLAGRTGGGGTRKANVVPILPVPTSVGNADPHTLAAAHVLVSGLGM